MQESLEIKLQQNKFNHLGLRIRISESHHIIQYLCGAL